MDSTFVVSHIACMSGRRAQCDLASQSIDWCVSQGQRVCRWFNARHKFPCGVGNLLRLGTVQLGSHIPWILVERHPCVGASGYAMACKPYDGTSFEVHPVVVVPHNLSVVRVLPMLSWDGMSMPIELPCSLAP